MSTAVTGALRIDGNLQPTLAPLADLLKQHGFLAADGRSTGDGPTDFSTVSPDFLPPSPEAKEGAQPAEAERAAPKTPTLVSESLVHDLRKVAGSLNNGHEFLTAATSLWDRHLKTALKKFLNANGATPALRTGFGWGTEWNVEAITALQIFLRARGYTELEVTKKMGLFGTVSFGYCEDDPTVKALQRFLNSQMVAARDGKWRPHLSVDADVEVEYKRPFSGSPQKKTDDADVDADQFNEFNFWKQDSPTHLGSLPATRCRCTRP